MSRKMRPPRVDNSDRPGKRAQHDCERADKDAGAGIQSAPAHQQADASESQEDSRQKSSVQAPLPGGGSGEQEDPDRLAGNEQRSEAGRHFLLRPMKRAVADKKKEHADDDAGANLRPGRPKTFCQAPREENRAGGQVAKPRSVERRNGFHGIANREVRGAPDEVDGKKGKNNRDAM